jgi:hypothetical protein
MYEGQLAAPGAVEKLRLGNATSFAADAKKNLAQQREPLAEEMSKDMAAHTWRT